MQEAGGRDEQHPGVLDDAASDPAAKPSPDERPHVRGIARVRVRCQERVGSPLVRIGQIPVASDSPARPLPPFPVVIMMAEGSTLQANAHPFLERQQARKTATLSRFCQVGQVQPQRRRDMTDWSTSHDARTGNPLPKVAHRHHGQPVDARVRLVRRGLHNDRRCFRSGTDLADMRGTERLRSAVDGT